MKKLVLASQSAGRKGLLEAAMIDFVVDVSNYEEDMTLDMSPQDLAIHLSQGKARDVAKRHKNAVIIGADSFVSFNGELMGKPHTRERAFEMLTKLNGHSHTFITGFTDIDTDTGHEISESQETKVTLKKLTPEEIKRYIDKADVLNKAASYTTGGPGMLFIEKFEGDYTNVVGLPMPSVWERLKDFGVNLL